MRVQFIVNGRYIKKEINLDIVPAKGDTVDILSMVSHKFFTEIGHVHVDKCLNHAQVLWRCLKKDKEGYYWEVLMRIQIPHPAMDND